MTPDEHLAAALSGFEALQFDPDDLQTPVMLHALLSIAWNLAELNDRQARQEAALAASRADRAPSG
ncbi:hypothetical protein SEA_LILPHARAOH_1 [Mycobacterium phage LilPharaoh]|nr:hypothetical protein SEA_LILPHARAOH_1 [Mycobacterium phage LilPharaoh]